MDEEEEDKALLSTLGVTSADPQDIERQVLEKARKYAEDSKRGVEKGEDETLNETEENAKCSIQYGNLSNKLRVVNVEIAAVAATVEQLDNYKRHEDRPLDDDEDKVVHNSELGPNFVKTTQNDVTLQHALAADRLKSLLKTRAQLEKEISESSTSTLNDSLIRSLVSEESKPKKTLKNADETSRGRKKRLRKAAVIEDDDFDAVLNAASTGFVETEKDELVRKGFLTPFHMLKGYERRIKEPGPSNRNTVSDDAGENADLGSSSIARAAQSMSEAARARPTTKVLDPEQAPRIDAPSIPFQRLRKTFKNHQSLEMGSEKDKDIKRKSRRPQPGKKWTERVSNEEKLNGDDVESSSNEDDIHEESEDADDEGHRFVTLEGGLKIPETIFTKLFDYQKVGVQWLWELHCQRAGGIIGDEMGLGKTIQLLAFLGSLHFSGMYKPSIIVCPVTILRQWKREANKWYPDFHVELLHDSAQETPPIRRKRRRSDDFDSESDEYIDSDSEENISSKSRKIKKWDSLINRVLRSESGLLITTYEQLRLQGDVLLDIEWGYAVLDEGHRIRNPNADITLVCKQLQTVHRVIMTGSPIQNKLSELWSLFDFVFPGKLGVLPVFEAEFAVPISVGGYANATPLQVSTAYRCAVVLCDLIIPYLLRRMKADVDAQLTKKTEHVLFCSLTPEQRSVYRAFLASSEVEQILDGSRNSLYGIDVMRKICNHPDLLEREHSSSNPDFGNPQRSGKMKVVAEVLQVWKKQGHHVLLFAQTQQMLDIIENFLIGSGYSYRRMDGLTPVKQRMALIDEFNNSEDVFIFILTTKVGGLGTNLTGANRVIIFDPDWNPSTDMQARERAWRIGQTKDVTVYRLITRGTIEEKVYQRQIYKHFLTNKILKNPQQRRFFKARDMKDLFTLNDDDSSTETSNIFSQLSEVDIIKAERNRGKGKKLVNAKESTSYDSATDTRHDSVNGDADDDSGGDRNRKADEEMSFLQSLFEAHGIHSAVNHDAIMNANDKEKTEIEEHASRVAQRAAEALSQSRMLRSRESITVPTWTGRSGAAGAPSSVHRRFGSTVNSQLVGPSKSSEDPMSDGNDMTQRFSAGASSGRALSSAELIAKIRRDQQSAVMDGFEHQLGSGSISNNGSSRSNNHNTSVQPEVLIRQICTFIQRKGGSTSSSSIVDHFRDRIPSKDLPLFKNLLKEIATLDRSPEGSHWVLKPEHRDQ